MRQWPAPRACADFGGSDDDASASCGRRYDEFFTEVASEYSPIPSTAAASRSGGRGWRHIDGLREFVGIRADPTEIAEIAPTLFASDVLSPRRGVDQLPRWTRPLIGVGNELRDTGPARMDTGLPSTVGYGSHVTPRRAEAQRA